MLVLLAAVAGCSTSVTGSGAAADPTSTTTAATTTTRTTTRIPPTTTTEASKSTPVPLPTIDESAPAQYCEDPFPGALGKPMLAVVVETPAGRMRCDQAASVLVDYYAQRHDPTPGLPPLEVGPMTCNQVPEPAMPQVVCTDGKDVIYSMWPQR
ncbi:hypothetical protein AB0G02_38350 [Actinosynnema sp. NPDC023658]|uniref:hypothetical protein n=1 Tax=Actinosynnema sp. NPDC023658 TaxID=3155465 RepID=UPI0033E0E6BF